MKKFLTVLLVIAVMFTFSFGSAFAVTKADYNATLAKTYFDSTMNAVKESATGGIVLTGAGESYTVKYATLAAHADAIFDAVAEFVVANDEAYVGNGSLANEINRLAFVLNTADNAELKMALVAEQYAADKADALAVLNSLSVADYSTEELSSALKTALSATGTYQEYVEKLVSDAVSAINKAAFNSDSTVKSYADAKAVIDGYFDAAAQAAVGSAKLVVEKYYTGASNEVIGLGVYQINTAFPVAGTTLAAFKASYVAGENAVAAANVAAVKAAIASGYADYMRESDANSTKAAQAKAMLDFLAEEGEYTSTVAADAKGRIAAADAAKVNAAVTQVAELEAVAAQLGAEVDSTGALVRDAEDVADIVTEGTVAAYNYALGRTATAYNAATYEGKIEALYSSLDAEKLAYMKEMRATAVADFLADAADAYYPAEVAELTEITEAYLAKVNAVTSCSKVNKYDEKLKTDVDAVLLQGEVAAKSAVASLKKMANEYVTFLNNQITKKANEYYVGEKLNKEIEKLVGNSDARTTAAINALSEEALALVKALPTNAEVEAAEEAADDAVKALPTTVKTADKATIDAAIAAIDAYETLSAATYDNTAAVTTAITKYAYAYLNEMTAAVKAVDKADKAAVEALIDQFEATVDEYEDYTDLTNVFKGQVDKLEGYLDAIQAAAASNVRKAIAAIPVKANITVADEAKVAAARTAYDAYVADYTNYRDYDYDYKATVTTDGFVADDFEYAALAGAETLLGLNVEDEAYSVEGLKITAKSSAKKGSITVKWSVKGDTSAVEGYEIWKSTKKNSGFKKAFTTEKMSYKNTKGLKKGTRYFYKVRAIAYTEEGVKVTSDWSNKAYRVAK